MDLPNKNEPFKRESRGQRLSCGLEKASCPKFYQQKEINSANNHVSLEEDPEPQ